MKKNILSLFSGCGGMDIGFEGDFKVPKTTINTSICKDWIAKEEAFYYHLKPTIFETQFANDINSHAKTAWTNYFATKKTDVDAVFRLGSIVDLVKAYYAGDTTIFPENTAIVTGGFPCQDFSIAGKRKGFQSHKDHQGKYISTDVPTEETRGKLYMWMKAVIEITDPIYSLQKM